MAEQGDPKEPARRSGENSLPVALVVGAILALIAIATFAGTY